MNEMIPISIPDPLRTAWLDASDLGNARRLVVIATGKLLWIEEEESFAWYDGTRWALERGNIEAMKFAHRVIEHIDAEAAALAEIAGDPMALKRQVGDWCTEEIALDRVKALRGHAVRSGGAGNTAGMLRQARALMCASVDDFDKDPLIYNCRNFTLRFVHGPQGWRVTARPHDPADMLMQRADVDYEPDASCPFWIERLAQLTPDAEQLDALKVLYGYSLTGLTSDQSFYVHQGKGGDGKSATHMALAALHGDYYRHAGIATFLQSSNQKAGSEHRSDLVRLKGDIRFVTCDEPPPRSVWDGGVIKQITGSFVTARGANARHEITFPPRCKIHAECNVIPRAPSDDKGFRRRFKLYMWRVSLSDTLQGEMPIDVVLMKLASERSGILNWLIAGAIDWLTTRKILQPKAMTEVLADFWADSSPLLEWIAEWCDTGDPAAKTLAKSLYSHFKNWCEERGIEKERVMSSTKFGSELRNKQFMPWKDSQGQRYRLGIALRLQGMFTAPPAAPQDDAAWPLPPEAVDSAGLAVLDDLGGDDDVL